MQRRGYRPSRRTGISSLSKSRKKFGPCSSSVQVSTFNRFPIWFLQERKKKERERKKSMCEVKKSSISYLNKDGRKGRSELKEQEVTTEWKEKRRRKREEHKQSPSGLCHREQRPADRKETAELITPPLPTSLSPSIFSPFVPLFCQTYFQSPGKSVDSSLFPLLGLLAGYPFQQT